MYPGGRQAAWACICLEQFIQIVVISPLYLSETLLDLLLPYTFPQAQSKILLLHPPFSRLSHVPDIAAILSTLWFVILLQLLCNIYYYYYIYIIIIFIIK